MNTQRFDIITVTLNPAIDRTVTISNFTAGEVNRVETVRSNPGGKGVNVAASLADAGHRVAVTGYLGRENAASFDQLFEAKKIADHFIRIPGPTRVGIKVVDPVLNQTTDINFPGSVIAPADQDALAERITSLYAECFVLAGSLPLGVDPKIYQQLVTALRFRGARVVLDVSGEPLRHALEAKPEVIKPNIDELSELLGETLESEREIIAAARKLIAHGIEQVVVSMGPKGACFVTANEAVIAQPPDIAVRSTVGAGDAMVAGLVSAHTRGLSLSETARLATAFSVHALTPNPDMPNLLTAVRSILPQVTLK